MLPRRLSGNDSDIDDKTMKRKRGKAKTYDQMFSYENYREIKAKMKEMETEWIYRYTRETKETKIQLQKSPRISEASNRNSTRKRVDNNNIGIQR